MALLREIFGKGIERVRMEHKAFKTPSGKAIEMVTIASAYHIEINPGDAGIYDRFVVQDVIKEMAASVPIFSGGLAGTGSSAAATACPLAPPLLPRRWIAANGKAVERQSQTDSLIVRGSTAQLDVVWMYGQPLFI